MQVQTSTQSNVTDIAHGVTNYVRDDFKSKIQNPKSKIQNVTSNTRSSADFKRVLQRFSPINLAEMHSVALLRRIDTKYVLSEAQLHQALTRLTADYDVLEIAGQRLHHYQTLYFDTPDFALYRQHHDGWRTRYKVRSRIYVDSNTAFLEVKRKTNKDITVKDRLQTSDIVTQVAAHDNTGVDRFLHAHFPQTLETLAPQLWNDFYRITLVSKHSVERLTLDVGLSFQAEGTQTALPGVAVAEVKQEAFSLRSKFVGQMRALGVRSMSFSKYCIGVSRLYTHVKHNNFKPQWRHINKITGERI
jgi:hypothetical protein